MLEKKYSSGKMCRDRGKPIVKTFSRRYYTGSTKVREGK